ncbi:MAG: hypothetical protein FJ150_03690 [Euryarchaeota archaeon]|nr:hypothetical protein [Euryarchaeota archaeon]
MADIVTIPQNIFYIIISVIVVVAVIVVAIQWRKVRETQNKIVLIDKEIELRKLALVERDLEAKRIRETVVALPKEQQQKLSNIKEETAKLMHKIGYLHSEISERVTLLEAKTEFTKLQELLREVEDKEKEVGEKIQKSGDSK